MAIYTPAEFLHDFMRYASLVEPYDAGSCCEIEVEFYVDQDGKPRLLVTDLVADRIGVSFGMHRCDVVGSLLISSFNLFLMFNYVDFSKNRTFVLFEDKTGKYHLIEGGA